MLASFPFKWLRRLLLLAAASLLLLALAVALVPLPDDKLNPAQAHRFYGADQQLLAVHIASDDFYRMHVPVEKISPLFIRALLAHEDQYFYQHPGINPLAIARAMSANIGAGRVVSGGSTITMQLARMLDRQPRTLWAKGIEALRALKLEWTFSKNEILAHYLAIAPYGGNIEGIEAAAYAYFAKSARHLSIAEVALLIAIPQSPNRFRPDRHPQAAAAARNRVLEKMRRAELINQQQLQRALAEAVSVVRQRPENLIPHLSWRLRSEASDSRQYQHFTSIDKNLQLRARQLLRKHLAAFRAFHIQNGAIVVIDNASREVVASVGAADYFDAHALGANDGSKMARSPGSTLKPFLYGLAFDAGEISEQTVLYDMPVTYAGYSPQNYSLDYLGPVTAREALTRSLNVIPIKLSQQLGIGALHGLLQRGGISTLNPDPQHYGLPLVLGGVETRLDELTNLYASLADGGRYRPYSISPSQQSIELPSETRLMSPAAAWLVLDILTDVTRPDFPSSWEFSRDRPTVAWKTGTSYGNRDAWSIGVTPQYTVGVWVGNFDGQSSMGLVGSQAAAPLLFDVLQALDLRNDWFPQPEGIAQRQVCEVCGLLPNAYCPVTIKDRYIASAKGYTTETLCNIPQQIVIDSRNGAQANSDTPQRFRRLDSYNIYPSRIASFLRARGVPVTDTPAYDINNMAGQKYFPPEIVKPAANSEFVRRDDKLSPEQQAIRLEGAVTNRIKEVSWYLNGELLMKGPPATPVFITPSVGEHTLRLVDDVGGVDELRFSVKHPRSLGQD